MPVKMQSLVLLWGLAAAGMAGAAMPKAEPPLTQAAYEAAQDRIDAQYQADRKLCDPLKSQPQKVCEAEAEGRRDSLRAELDAKYKPSPDATQKAKNVTAEANYDVAKAKCGALKDGAKSRCMKEAKAAREAAIRQAKVEKVQETGGAFAGRKARKAANVAGAS